MLNINNFESLIKLTHKDKEYFQSLLSKEKVGFTDISNFPEARGLYFLFYKDTLLYIGSVSANDRTIKIRCQQYLHKGSGEKVLEEK